MRFISASFIRSSSFFSRISASVSGGLVSSSFTVTLHKNLGGFEGNFTSNKVEYLVPSQSAGGNDDVKVLTISASGDNPRVGIGVETPLRAFDFKEVRDDNRGGELLIRGSRTTKGAETNDEVGRINFAIDSASFGKIDTSGSAAEIVALVDEVDETGIKGHMSFRTAIAKTGAPTELLKLSQSTSVLNSPLDLNGALSVDSSDINASTINRYNNTSTRIELASNHLEFYGNAYGMEISNTGIDANPSGLANMDFRVRSDNDAAAILVDSGDNTITLGSSANTHITASGNISASGDIIASNLDISGDVDVDGTLEADAITVGGTALATVIASTSVALASTAVNANNIKVANDTGDAEHPITFIDDTSPDGGNESLKGNANITVNPANASLTLAEITASGNISASGTGYFNAIRMPQDDGSLTSKLYFGSAPDGDNGYLYDDETNLHIGYNDSDVLSINNATPQVSVTGNFRVFGGGGGNITASGDISSSGTITGNSIRMGNGSVSAPALAFTSDTNTGLYAINTDTLGIAAGGALNFTAGSNSNSFSKPLSLSVSDGDGAILSVTNTYSGTTSADSYAIKAVGNAVIGIPGSQNKAYAGHFTAGNTNTANPDTIALFAQGHEDGAPNSYAAVFSGSAGGIVGINTMEPTVELEVSGDGKFSGALEIGGISDVSASIATAIAGGGGGSSTVRFQVNGACFLGQTTQRAMPFGSSTGESTSFSYTTTYMIPADCKLVRVHTCSQSNSGTVTLKAYTIPDTTADNTAISNGTLLQTVAVSNHDAGDPFEFTFGSTGTISKNTKFGLTVESDTNPNGFRFTAYFEEV